MEENLKEKLSSELYVTSWSVLENHYKKDVLFLVKNDIDLVDAGVAIANDDVTQVKIWQESQSLRRPTEKEVSDWSKSKNLNLFEFLVIQPYVIIKVKNSQ